MSVTLINGRAYDYTQVVVNVLGVPLAGVTSIEYSEEQDKTNNFGTGNRPVSRGHGAIDSKGTIEISMNDVEAIRDVAPNGSFLQIPAFDIVVTYGNPQKVVTHTLKNCEFTTDMAGGAQGDTDIKKTFDLVIAEVVWR